MSPISAAKEAVLGPDWNGAVLTPQEFDAIEECDEEYVYELVNGVAIVSPPPLEAERGPNDELGHLLLQYREHHPNGSTLDGTLPEHTVSTRNNRRRADRVIWSGLGHHPDPRNDVPTFVVEFVSAGKRSRERDCQEKRHEYRELGVAEYWIVDRFRRTLIVCRKDGTEQIISEGETYTTPLLPGFELPLASLLSAADRWS